MRKIPTLFVRDPKNPKRVTREVTAGCEWVLEGEGVATRKWDGACAMIRDGVLYKRYELRPGVETPKWFEPAQDPDRNPSRLFAGVRVGEGPEDQWFREAFQTFREAGEILGCHSEDGTYEAVGPKFQGNPEKLEYHSLYQHGAWTLDRVTLRSWCDIRDYLQCTDIEGIVWHHPDGRMVKIKARDFGVGRGAK